MTVNCETIDSWRFINSFAPWFSAAGTITAVIVSLYLARSREKIKLVVRAGERLMLFRDGTPIEKAPRYLYISIINIGSREVIVNNIGWKIGLFSKKYAVQPVEDRTYSSALPIKLKDGDEAKYFILLSEPSNWLDEFAKDFILDHGAYMVNRVWVQVFTSVGTIFETKLEKNMRDKLTEKYNELKTKQTS